MVNAVALLSVNAILMSLLLALIAAVLTSPVTLPVTLPVTSPVKFPVTLPVTAPVKFPVTDVVVNTPVDGLYVNPVSVLGERFPVAALTNRGNLVALVVLSAVNVTADEYVAVSALPVTLPVTLPVSGPENDVAVTAPVMPTVPVIVVAPVMLVAACNSMVPVPPGFYSRLALVAVLMLLSLNIK
jgi:hypothetical protein